MLPLDANFVGYGRSKAAVIEHSHQGFGRVYQVACPTTPYLPGMKRKTAHIDVRVEPTLIEKIDAWCNQQRVRPS